jgi:glycosyltransferase involved in cell wall biosynthesis
MSAPAVSVVIPAYNAERYLPAALDSVLAQTYPAQEIIVVDDGSADATLQAARRYGPPVQAHAQAHSGPAVARNLGVSLARGDFLAFLDADDLWAADKLECQLAALAADPALDMVFGLSRQFASPELDDAVKARLARDGQVLAGYYTGAFLIRRAAFDRVGPFSTELRVGEFLDWYMRAVDAGLRGHMLPQVVVQRRMHTDNQTVRDRHAQGDYVRLLKAGLDRRRAQPPRNG